uniref:Protein TSSC1 n=1 Tax=Magallana gigas TaxID=29159 RepID=K1RF60_MAGGI
MLVASKHFKLFVVDEAHTVLHCVLWHPTGDTTTLVGLTDSHIITWDFDASSSVAKVKDSTGLESKGQPKFTCVRWNPHHNCTQVATANDSCIRGWDLRSMQ